MFCWVAWLVLMAPLAFIFRREIQTSFGNMDASLMPSSSMSDPSLMIVLVPMLAMVFVTLLGILLALAGCGKINHHPETYSSRSRATATEVLKAV